MIKFRRIILYYEEYWEIIVCGSDFANWDGNGFGDGYCYRIGSGSSFVKGNGDKFYPDGMIIIK